VRIVVAGILRKVFGSSDDHPPCPFRVKPIQCKGRLSELFNEDGTHRRHHSGIMPDPRNQRPGQYSITPDTGKDPVQKIEAQCDYCLVHIWGHSLKTISDHTEWLPQDIETWKNTREIKVMKRFSPGVFPPDQIKRAEEQARR